MQKNKRVDAKRGGWTLELQKRCKSKRVDASRDRWTPTGSMELQKVANLRGLMPEGACRDRLDCKKKGAKVIGLMH